MCELYKLICKVFVEKIDLKRSMCHLLCGSPLLVDLMVALQSLCCNLTLILWCLEQLLIHSRT